MTGNNIHVDKLPLIKEVAYNFARTVECSVYLYNCLLMF